jgi:predicted Zn-dependent protease
MRLKPKRRLLLLAAAAAVLAIGAFAFLVVRNWQRGRMTDRALDAGLAAHQAGDYYTAMERITEYIKRAKVMSRQNDPRRPDALLAYADSRRNVLEYDGHNYVDAIPHYMEYLSLRPGDRDAAITLLRTYNLCGRGAEAYGLAATLRPELDRCTEADLPVLREEAVGDLNAKAYDRLEKVVERIVALAPTDLVGHRCRIIAMANRNERGPARAYADALLKDHPDDQSALLIAALSRQIEPVASDMDAALEWTSRAAGLDAKTGDRVAPIKYADTPHAVQMVELFDRMRHFDRSLIVLRDAAGALNDLDLQRVLVRRLWQDNQFDEVLERTASLDPGAMHSDADLLGFRALALIAKGRGPEAEAIQATLHQRKGDYRLAAWDKALTLMDPARAPKPAEAVSKWREVVGPKCSPYEPVYHLAFGETLAALGRSEEARAEWDAAAKAFIAASWPLPHYRIAQTLLAEGRAEEAARAAGQAYAIGGGRSPIVALWFETQSAVIQKGSPGALPAGEVLADLERALEALANTKGNAEALAAARERLLVPHLILLVHAGRREKARDLALASLDTPLAAETLQRLAATSRIEALGIDDAVAQRLVQAKATDAPLLKAIELADAGKLDEAVALLKSAAAEHPSDAAALTALPRLYERLGRPEARAAWIAVGDASTDNLGVQRACLQSAVAAGDPAFIDRTIDRYSTLTGAETEMDALIVCARARALMASNGGVPSRSDRDKAVAMLGAFIGKNQQLTEPHIILASALAYSRPPEIRPDLDRAVQELGKAAALEPRSVAISLQLARLYQIRGELGRARDQLAPIAADGSMDRQIRRTAAEMLISQGDAGGVGLSALDEVTSQMGDQAPTRLLVTLAEAHLRAGQPGAAKPIYERLAAGAANDADSIYATARYFLQAGDQAKADAALARLDAAKPGPGVREAIRARLASDRGDIADAIEAFEACVKAAPQRADFWAHYAGTLLQRLRYADAAAVARRGLDANPRDPQLASLLNQSQALVKGGPDADLQALIAALAADPATADAADALRSIPSGGSSAATRDALDQLAARFPTQPLLQAYISRRLAAYDPQAAVTVIQRSMKASPNDPAPARAAAELCLALDRWPDMLRAAQEWRRRDRSGAIEPDLAIAQAHLGLKQAQPGLEALSSRIPAATEHPEDPYSAPLLNIYARLLILGGREPEARALLEPLLARSQTIRIGVWLTIARDAVPDCPTALAWLDKVPAAIPPDQPEDRIALAKAYYVLGDRFTDQQADLFKRALGMMTELSSATPTATAETFQALAIIRHRTGNLDEAEAAYVRAIELDPKDGLSLNNLANLVMQRHADPTKAMDLATRAVAATPTPSTFDTLAGIQRELGRQADQNSDRAKAVGYFRQAAQNYRYAAAGSGDPAMLINAASASEQAGEPQDVLAAVQAYDEVLTKPLPADKVPLIKNNLAMALLRLKRGPDDLGRARSLIDEAIRAAPHWALYDTKGWIELAHADAAAAEAAFRKAIDLFKSGNSPEKDEAKGLPSSVIGLATALAGGGAEQRAEASRRLQAVDASALTTPDDKARFQRARELLGSSGG